MDLILKILGIVFLVLIVIAIGAFFFLRKKWRSLVAGLGQEMDGTPPMSIHLNQDLNPEWTQEPEVADMIEEVESLGFYKGKAYAIKEMAAVKFASLFRPQRDACAVVSKHDNGMLWLEFVLEYQDGSDLTVTNAPMGGEMDTRPECEKIVVRNAPVSELYETFKAKIQPKPKVPIDDSNFREVFEESYRRDMAWRAAKGGVSEEEIKRVMESGDISLDEEELQDAVMDIKKKELYTWHEECIDHALKKKNVPPEKWDLYKRRIFIVTDQAHTPSFIEYLDDFLNFDEAQLDGFLQLAKTGQKASDLFALINDSLSPELRGKKLGTVDYPVAATLFKVPSG